MTYAPSQSLQEKIDLLIRENDLIVDQQHQVLKENQKLEEEFQIKEIECARFAWYRLTQ